MDFLSSKGELVLVELEGKGNKTSGEAEVCLLFRRLPEISFCMNENSLTRESPYALPLARARARASRIEQPVSPFRSVYF